jgi:hypothetical protein
MPSLLRPVQTIFPSKTLAIASTLLAARCPASAQERACYNRMMFARVLRILMFLAGTAGAAARAEDRIVQRSSSGSRIGMPCVILDYTGREVVFQLKSGGPSRRLPRREIVDVTTQYTVPHNEARELLAQGHARDAFEKLNTALEQENRTWVRREILATQVKCALWNGDRITAGERFLAIYDSDPETVYFPLMPLAWDDRPPSEELSRAARRWLAQKDHPAAMLLGASHLLTDGDGSAAEKAIRDLARNENAALQRYAQIQIWRSRVLTGDMPAEELLRWERLFEEAGADLGPAPRFILGLGWRQRQDDLAAAAAWLWLPFLKCDDRWLSAEAQFRAGQAMEHAALNAQAAATYHELAKRYADTPFAAPAAEAGQRLASDRKAK